MKKTLLTLTLALLAAVGAWAQSISAIGYCGQNLRWVLYEHGTMTISGTGVMYNYPNPTASPWRNIENVKNVIIEEGVTNIGKYAFSNCTSVTKVSIPNSVQSIENLAFYGCTSLKEVTIPVGVTSIGINAFTNCTSMSRATILAEMPPVIETNSFRTNVSGNFTVYIPPSSLEAYQQAENWSSLNLVGLVDSGTCGVAGDNLTWVFGDDDRLAISGTGAMADFAAEDAPWYKSYNTRIKEVVIEEGVTTIGSHAFNNCSEVAKITISNGVVIIGASAFEGCSSLIQITIPESVNRINGLAFSGCSSLKELAIFATTPPTMWNDIFYDVSPSTIYVPYSKVDDYKTAVTWSTYADKIQGLIASVTTAPSAVANLVYTGNAQPLVAAGTAENGTMVYSLEETGEYSENIPTGTDAAEYTVYYKAQGDGVTYGDSEVESINVNIAQAANTWKTPLSIEGWIYGETANAPAAEAAFGDVVFTYSASATEGFAAAVPQTAGDWYVKATVAGTDNYTALESDPVGFAIAKADPVCTVPTDLTATEGQTLADVTLPDGWSWKDETLSVGEVGDNDFTALFTPEDTNNYNVVEKTVSINVSEGTAVDETAAPNIYAVGGTIYVEAEDFVIYDLTGQDVTAQNGSLNGLYVVKVGEAVVKLKVKN